MRLASALEPLQNLIKLVLSGLSYEAAMVSLDKIVLGKTFEEHLPRLEQRFARLKKIDFT